MSLLLGERGVTHLGEAVGRPGKARKARLVREARLDREVECVFNRGREFGRPKGFVAGKEARGVIRIGGNCSRIGVPELEVVRLQLETLTDDLPGADLQRDPGEPDCADYPDELDSPRRGLSPHTSRIVSPVAVGAAAPLRRAWAGESPKWSHSSSTTSRQRSATARGRSPSRGPWSSAWATTVSPPRERLARAVLQDIRCSSSTSIGSPRPYRATEASSP